MEEFILKDGSVTNDKRLDRIPQFDERSRMYRVTALTTERQPLNKVHLCTGFLDQKLEGACVGFGLAHALLAEPRQMEKKAVTHKYAKEFIYWEAQKEDPWEGGSYPGANPFYEGTSVLAGVQVLHKKGIINGYYHAFNITDLIVGLSYAGPAVVGVDFFEGMMDTDEDGFIHVTGDSVGGHCLLMEGINWTEEYFLLHNSWGIKWGINGRCKVSFANTEKLMKNGEFIFLT